MKIAVICDVLGQENNGTTIACNEPDPLASEKRSYSPCGLCRPDLVRILPDFYIVPKFNFGPFNHYVEKNGVSPARVDHHILESAIADVDIIHVMLPFGLGKAAADLCLNTSYPADCRLPLSGGKFNRASSVERFQFRKPDHL